MIMKKLLFGLVCILPLFLSCKNETEKSKSVEKKTVLNVETEETVRFPVYDYEGIAPLLYTNTDKTYIVNFWATWCKPCIEELPGFEKLYAETKQNNVEMILVSLDMPNMWKTQLEPFVENHKLQGKVVILDDPKMNTWIPKVDKDWGGGIPATLIFNKEERAFYERGFTYEELKKELDKFL
ncbi:thiol:disulfide interchange protein [Croceivirga lutea]|nr:thiol:disulfide interchange protein [Croceivirga lutea]